MPCRADRRARRRRFVRGRWWATARRFASSRLLPIQSAAQIRYRPRIDVEDRPVLTPAEAKRRWRGVVAPIVTPLADDLSLGLDALRPNLRWLFDRGAVAGNTILLVAGSGGDWPMMNLDERKAVIEASCEVNDGRLPVIASAQSFDIRDSAAIARFCEGLGVDAIQIGAPAYWSGRQGDVVAWLTELAS